VEPTPSPWATEDDGRIAAVLWKVDSSGEDLGSLAVLPVAVMKTNANKPPVGKMASEEGGFFTFQRFNGSFGESE